MKRFSTASAVSSTIPSDSGFSEELNPSGLDSATTLDDNEVTASYPTRTSHVRQLAARRIRTIETDPDKIGAHLRNLCTAHAMGSVRVAGPLGASNCVGSAELGPGPRLLISADFLANALNSTWEIEVEGPYSLVVFELKPEDRLRDGLFVCPRAIECSYRRTDRRISAPPAAWLSFSPPGLPNVLVKRPLRDLGYRGLRFAARPEDGLEIGQELGDVEVTWKHGPSVQLSAQVRHLTAGVMPGEELCGVVIHAASRSVQDDWRREVSSLLHPDTAIGLRGVSDKLWELYDRSGYFGLGGTSAADMETLKAPFADATERLAQAPQLGCQVVRCWQSRIEASMTLLRAWSGSWLAYQLARRQEENPLALSGNAVLREMYQHAYESLQQDSDFRWHVSYVRKDARFSRRICCEFAERFDDGQNVAVVPFRAMEVTCQTPLSVVLRREIEVSPATPKAILAALDVLGSEYPEAYLDAYDLNPDSYDLSEVRTAWAEAGLNRERQWLLARHQGLPSAVAILDLCSDGLHLVGLLDSVHLVALRPNAVECFPALLRSAQDFYRRRNKRKFMLFEETDDPSYATNIGVRDMGAAEQIFVSSKLTPEFLDHICLITSPRATALT